MQICEFTFLPHRHLYVSSLIMREKWSFGIWWPQPSLSSLLQNRLTIYASIENFALATPSPWFTVRLNTTLSDGYACNCGHFWTSTGGIYLCLWRGRLADKLGPWHQLFKPWTELSSAGINTPKTYWVIEWTVLSTLWTTRPWTWNLLLLNSSPSLTFYVDAGSTS